MFRNLWTRPAAPPLQRVRRAALICALPVAGLAAVIVFTDRGQGLIARGPIQSGHAETPCAGCHRPAPGTPRQQIQANLRHLAGLRAKPADYGFAPVGSAACLACHERPNERHPIYRFREPRFAEARAVVEATTCLGCHSEHRDERVSAGLTFCRACHGELELKLDPLDIPHHQLIAAKDWESCLGCHDFHGNHARKPQRRILAAHETAVLLDYLKDGDSPYAAEKIYRAVNEMTP